MNSFTLYALLSIIALTSAAPLPQFGTGFEDGTGGGFSPGGFFGKRSAVATTNGGTAGNTHSVDVNGVGGIPAAGSAVTSGSVENGVVLDATKRQIESVGFDKFKT
jgi:hypothetical protein